MRTGREYLEAIRDRRRVFVNGEAVADVTTHPAFSGVTSTVAKLYDTSSDPKNGMQFTDPETGITANRVFQIPRSRDDLRQRREAIATWARLSNGFLGRAPDHVGGFLAGFAGNPEVFSQGERDFSQNVTNFYRRLLEEDLYVSYVIIPPQVDRSKTAQDWEDKFVQVGVTESNEKGMVVRGAQMLGTGAAIADYLFVSCIVPLRPGDEDHALSFVVPIDAKGLKFYCRRPYALGQPSTYDYPLSTRFDESDALVVFDDVFVPWEEVFAFRDLDALRNQFFQTAAHVLGNTQAQIRLTEKVKFIIGLARKIAATTQVDKIPGVQGMLGELASLATIVEGNVLAAEASSSNVEGVEKPNPRFLYGTMGLQAELYPRILHLVREIAGGGVLQVPSSYHEMNVPEIRKDMERYVQSPGSTSEEKIKLFKAAWDAISSEFGGRHHQYEMFYAGAPHVARANAFRNYGYEEALELVDQFLAGYSLEAQQEKAEAV